MNNNNNNNNSKYNYCGLCKNCKDKPCFGGLGIRKKSCSNKKIIGSLYALQMLSAIAVFMLEAEIRGYPLNPNYVR